MRRRDFLRLPCALAAGAAAGKLSGPARTAVVDEDRFLREAAFWDRRPGNQVVCRLCPNRCVVPEGQVSGCHVRVNQGGKYYTRVFGRPVTINNDPVEKKPLFHFLPNTRSLSISTGGCNFSCQFCQNWQLSQFGPDKLPSRHGFVSPARLVAMAERRGSASIALTYAEPIVAFEYDLAVARAGKKAGVPAVMISNGYIEPKPLDQLLDLLGAYKVDFKAFDEKFYREMCRGQLKPVLSTMKRIRERGVWLEIVHLTIPTLNDKPEQLKRLCDWVLSNVGPDVPVHFSRFHPTYMLTNLPPTPPSTLERAWLIAKQAGLHYPYVGNLPGSEAENTHCHSCGNLLIKRVGYSTEVEDLKDGKCAKCGQKIPGVWRWPA